MQCVVSSGQQSAIGYRLFVFREIGVPNPSHKDIYTISKCLSYTGFHGMSGDAEQTGSLFYRKRDLLPEMILVVRKLTINAKAYIIEEQNQ